LSEIKVIRKREAKHFMEGAEHCKLYVNTGKIVFGTSSLLAGKSGDIDPGHQKGDEIFYLAQGRVICHFPEKNIYHELEEGDLVVIPPGEPHQLINMNEETAVICWSLAPPDD
jgi:mannose-6-phosphate isomerase-like protein (cupin superfamily)